MNSICYALRRLYDNESWRGKTYDNIVIIYNEYIEKVFQPALNFTSKEIPNWLVNTAKNYAKAQNEEAEVSSTKYGEAIETEKLAETKSGSKVACVGSAIKQELNDNLKKVEENVEEEFDKIINEIRNIKWESDARDESLTKLEKHKRDFTTAIEEILNQMGQYATNAMRNIQEVDRNSVIGANGKISDTIKMDYEDVAAKASEVKAFTETIKTNIENINNEIKNINKKDGWRGALYNNFVEYYKGVYEKTLKNIVQFVCYYIPFWLAGSAKNMAESQGDDVHIASGIPTTSAECNGEGLPQFNIEFSKEATDFNDALINPMKDNILDYLKKIEDDVDSVYKKVQDVTLCWKSGALDQSLTQINTFKTEIEQAKTDIESKIKDYILQSTSNIQNAEDAANLQKNS